MTTVTVSEQIPEIDGTMVTQANTTPFVMGKIVLPTGDHLLTLTQDLDWEITYVFVCLTTDGDPVCGGQPNSGQCAVSIISRNVFTIAATVRTDTTTIQWIGVSL